MDNIIQRKMAEFEEKRNKSNEEPSIEKKIMVIKFEDFMEYAGDSIGNAFKDEQAEFDENKIKIILTEREGENPTCWGCQSDQPNQLAHMDPGGCLSDEPHIDYSTDSDMPSLVSDSDTLVNDSDSDSDISPLISDNEMDIDNN